MSPRAADCFRLLPLALCLVIAALSPAHAWSADSARRTLFNIPRGVAAERLAAFRTASRLQVLFDYDDLRSVTTNPVHGYLTPTEALVGMFAGTGVRFSFVNARTVGLRIRNTAEPGPVVAGRAAAGSSAPARRTRAFL